MLAKVAINHISDSSFEVFKSLIALWVSEGIEADDTTITDSSSSTIGATLFSNGWQKESIGQQFCQHKQRAVILGMSDGWTYHAFAAVIDLKWRFEEILVQSLLTSELVIWKHDQI